MSFIPEKTMRATVTKADRTTRAHKDKYNSAVRTEVWSRAQMDAHLEGLKTPAMKQNEQRVTRKMLARMARERFSVYEIAEHYGVSVGFVQRTMGGGVKK